MHLRTPTPMPMYDRAVRRALVASVARQVRSRLAALVTGATGSVQGRGAHSHKSTARRSA